MFLKSISDRTLLFIMILLIAYIYNRKQTKRSFTLTVCLFQIFYIILFLTGFLAWINIPEALFDVLWWGLSALGFYSCFIIRHSASPLLNISIVTTCIATFFGFLAFAMMGCAGS
ncbi:hypothetical protein ACFP65_00100 [Marinilactibacillus sp. GCM10026970]|uniref:hypothetical protein n=1 Tax=Marinilactibacillus sp. GCM10026970 TaxID=3252642 RepID=UPI00360FE95B